MRRLPSVFCFAYWTLEKKKKKNWTTIAQTNTTRPQSLHHWRKSILFGRFFMHGCLWRVSSFCLRLYMHICLRVSYLVFYVLFPLRFGFLCCFCFVFLFVFVLCFIFLHFKERGNKRTAKGTWTKNETCILARTYVAQEYIPTETNT